MKKIYKSPRTICVKLHTVKMMATSEYSSELPDYGEVGDEIETREFSNVNIWDNEW